MSVFIYTYIYVSIYLYMGVCIYKDTAPILLTSHDKWMSQVALMNYTSYTYEYVKSTHMNMFICVMLHMWICEIHTYEYVHMCHVTLMNQFALMNDSSYTYESNHTCESIKLHLWICSYVSCYTCEYVKSTHTNMFICVMSHKCVTCQHVFGYIWFIHI